MGWLKEGLIEYKRDIKSHKALSTGVAVVLGLCAVGAFEANCTREEDLAFENTDSEKSLEDNPEAGRIPLINGIEAEIV